MISKEKSFSGFKVLTFLSRNKAKIMALLNLVIPYDNAIKITITSVLMLGEELYKYYSKEKEVLD